MAASIGAPCRDAGDGERGGGGGGVTGCYRGHRLGMAGKGAFPPSVDMSQRRGTQSRGVSAGFTGIIIFRNFSFPDTNSFNS